LPTPLAFANSLPTYFPREFRPHSPNVLRLFAKRLANVQRNYAILRESLRSLRLPQRSLPQTGELFAKSVFDFDRFYIFAMNMFAVATYRLPPQMKINII
jgi:hypothetical protein